jgi:hypothetical protein
VATGSWLEKDADFARMKYYRWLSQRYLDAFGELHDPLVDTIFRYNHRDRKALYIAKARSRQASLAAKSVVRLDHVPFVLT